MFQLKSRIYNWSFPFFGVCSFRPLFNAPPSAIASKYCACRGKIFKDVRVNTLYISPSPLSLPLSSPSPSPCPLAHHTHCLYSIFTHPLPLILTVFSSCKICFVLSVSLFRTFLLSFSHTRSSQARNNTRTHTHTCTCTPAVTYAHTHTCPRTPALQQSHVKRAHHWFFYLVTTYYFSEPNENRKERFFFRLDPESRIQGQQLDFGFFGSLRKKTDRGSLSMIGHFQDQCK